MCTYTRRHWVRPLAVLCTLVVSALRVWGALHWVPSGGSPDLASVLWRGEDFAIRQFSTHLSCFYPLRQFSIHLTCFYLLRQFSIRFYPLRQFSTHLSCFYPLRQFSINLSCFYLFQWNQQWKFFSNFFNEISPKWSYNCCRTLGKPSCENVLR